MGIKQFTQLLTPRDLPENFFARKRVGLDFFNLVFKTARFSAFSLIVKDNTKVIEDYFRKLI